MKITSNGAGGKTGGVAGGKRSVEHRVLREQVLDDIVVDGSP